MKSGEFDDIGSSGPAAKKKSKKSKKSGRFYLSDEDLDGPVLDDEASKAEDPTGSSKSSQVPNEKIADFEDEADVVDFSGMKKKKKKKEKGKPKGFDALAEEEDIESMLSEEASEKTNETEDKNEEDETDYIDFASLTKKKKKDTGKSKGFASLIGEEASSVELDEIDEESSIDFSGMRKKKNKNKKDVSKGFGHLVDQDVEGALDDVEGPNGVQQTQVQNIYTLEGEIVNDADERDNIKFSGSKKKKKKNEASKGFTNLVDQDIDAILEDLDGGNGVQQLQEKNLHLLEDEIVNDADEVDNINFSGLKKKKKKKDTSKGFANLADQETNTIPDELHSPTSVQQSEWPLSKVMGFEGLNEVDEVETIDFTGLKKKKKKKETEASRGFSSLGDQENDETSLDSVQQVEKQVSNVVERDEPEIIDFSGSKKKKKKEKKEKSKDADKSIDQDEIDAILAELDGPKPVLQQDSQLTQDSREPSSEVVNETDVADVMQSAVSKKKKKKEREKGKSKQADDDDIDAILAELDGGKGEGGQRPQSQQDLEGLQPNDPPQPSIEGLEENVGEEAAESAAAKKKKKKKEREKAAKIAGKLVEQADEVPEVKQEATMSKVMDKKVPKHVREMQERLAKQREAEERIKREEEERRRKEEEEQRRLEELERQKEEAKRRRKEREKEKLLKKKQEGKLLTGKQKEEARRLALMREKLLAQKGTSEADTIPKDESAPKKPKYDNKKKKRFQGGESVSTELPMQDQEGPAPEELHMEMEVVEKELEVEPEVVTVAEEVAVEEEEEEEEEWDAKSWDDENIELPPVKSAFAEEEDLVSSKNTAKSVSIQPSQESKRNALPVKLTDQKPSQDAGDVKRPSSSVKAPPVLRPAHALSNGNESEEETESEETESEEEDADTKRRKEAALKKEARRAEALAKRSSEDLRSPICCILGHVDTGKTKLLDCIRRTNVQEGEAGGITQQIGATYFPMENIKERTKELKSEGEVKLPGLLVIDTPGHESFTNLRSRGSGLCDIAILVIDIMHGLEPQTLESLNLLKLRHTPFVVALNKVDRLYNWKSVPNSPIIKSLDRQSKDVMNEFERHTSQIVTELKEQGLNSELYYKNKEKRKVVSIVPTSAISGEGVPDLLMLLVHLTQKVMKDKLMYISEVECTVLEVKVIEGLGTTIDVILVNGVLHEGDQIVVCGMQGPIVTTIRALLTPHPMKELRVKGSYQHHKELKAAQGIKITAQGLEHAIAGTQLHVVGPDDDLEIVKEEAMQDMKNVMSRVDKSGEGVCVQASTLGSLEALLEFLKSPAVNIPVSGINIGPVHKRDVTKASVMLERKKKEYATILAFDVKVTPEAKELAEELGVRIFMADIIYHLFDQFTAYMKGIREEKRKEVADEAVFPCVLSIKPQFVFNKKDPIIVGVDVLEGVARIGTPLCVPSQDTIDIGRIASMEVNHKVVEVAKKGQAVAMKIVGSTPEETQKMYGRHFNFEDELVSHITRRSIDVLKENFRDELTVEEWKLVVKLKKLFNIQ